MAGHSNAMARRVRDAQQQDEKKEDDAKKEDEDKKKKKSAEEAGTTTDPAAIQRLINAADLNREGAVKMLMAAHDQIVAGQFDKRTEHRLGRQVNAKLFELMRRQIEFAELSEKDAPALNLLAQQRITAFIRLQAESADLQDPEAAMAQILTAQDLLILWWEQIDSRERTSIQQEVDNKLRLVEAEMHKGPLDGLMDMAQAQGPVKGQV